MWSLKVSVEVDRTTHEMLIKRGRKKLKVKQVYGTGTDTFGFTVEGRREDLPSLTDIFRIVDAKRLDRIGTIDLISLISVISEISDIKGVQVLQSLADVTIKGSEGIALQQEAAGAGAWVSPNAFNATQWDNGANTYDDNTATYASFKFPNWIGWTAFCELSLAAATKADKLRFYVDASATVLDIDVDVLKDGIWTHVFEGGFTREAWIEKPFTLGSVTKVRMRFRKTSEGEYVHIHEVDVWQAPSTGGELKVKVIP